MRTLLSLAIIAAVIATWCIFSGEAARESPIPVEQPLEVPAPPPPEEAPQIAGRVVDHRYRPVAGAEIELRGNVGSNSRWGPFTGGSILHRAASDDDGRFVLEPDELSLMSGQPLALRAWHAELATQVHDPLLPWYSSGSHLQPTIELAPRRPFEGVVVDTAGRPLADVEITVYPAISPGQLFEKLFVLEPGATIEGQVLEETSAEPISGAEVLMSHHRHRVIGTRTRSDAQGRWRLVVPSGTNADDWSIRIRAPCFETVSMPVRPPGTAVLLAHRCEARICGEVRDARSGHPVSDFVVHSSPGRSRLNSHVFRDAEGRFAIPIRSREPESCELRITAPGYAPAYLPEVLVEPQQDRYLSVKLTRGSQLTGRIVDPAGEPVAGARIVAIPARELGGEPDALSQIRDLEEYPDHPHAWTDARGRFVIGNASPGATILAVRHRDHPARNIGTIPAPDTGALDAGTIVLDVGSVLRGRIRDGRRDCGVVQVEDTRGESLPLDFTVAPDSTGAFELRGLPRCQLRLGRFFPGRSCFAMCNPVLVTIDTPGAYTVEVAHWSDCR